MRGAHDLHMPTSKHCHACRLPHGHPSVNGCACDFDALRSTIFFFGGGTPHAEVPGKDGSEGRDEGGKDGHRSDMVGDGDQLHGSWIHYSHMC